jgi:hypothetical protein
MGDPALYIDDDLSGIVLIPAPVQVLGDGAKLDTEVPGEVLRLVDAGVILPRSAV